MLLKVILFSFRKTEKVKKFQLIVYARREKVFYFEKFPFKVKILIFWTQTRTTTKLVLRRVIKPIHSVDLSYISLTFKVITSSIELLCH